MPQPVYPKVVVVIDTIAFFQRQCSASFVESCCHHTSHAGCLFKMSCLLRLVNRSSIFFGPKTAFLTAPFGTTDPKFSDIAQ